MLPGKPGWKDAASVLHSWQNPNVSAGAALTQESGLFAPQSVKVLQVMFGTDATGSVSHVSPGPSTTPLPQHSTTVGLFPVPLAGNFPTHISPAGQSASFPHGVVVVTEQ